MSLEVFESYPVNLLVGPVVTGFRDRGFPWGGPVDPVLAGVALKLAGCGAGVGVLELAGPLGIRAQGRVCVGVAFAEGEGLGCRRMVLEDGEEVRFLPPALAVRSYVAVHGLGEWIGTGTNVLASGVLEAGCPAEAREFKLADAVGCDWRTIRWVAAEGFEGGDFEAEVLPSGSRMGMRFDAGFEGRAAMALSEPSVTGGMQVTPDGTLLVHGVDGPTLGGYPKIGGVIRADWRKIGMVRPGERVRFQSVDREEAVGAWLEAKREFAELMARLDLALLASGG